MKPIMKIGFTLLVFIMSILAMKGANRYSVATGSWSSTSTWSATSGGGSGASVPVAGDVVFIEGNRTVTVSSTAACTNVSIAAGSTLSIGGANFTVSGTTTVSGTVLHTSTSRTKNMGNVVMTGGTWTSSASENYGITSLTLSGSTFNGTSTGILNVSGTLTVTAGTTNTLNPVTITVNGISTINGTLTIANTSGSKTFVGRVTIGATGNWNNTSNESVSFRGGITNSGTFTAGTGTYSFNTNSQSLIGTFVIPTVSISTPTTLTNTGTLTCGTSFTGTGGFAQAANSTLNLGGSATVTTFSANASPNLVNYYGTAQTVKPVAYNNLTLSGSSTKTLTSVTTINGNLTMSGTTSAAIATNVTIGGNLTIGTGTTLTVGGFNFSVTGTTTVSGTHIHNSTSGNKTYSNDVTINSGGIWNETAAAIVNYGGNLQNNGTLTASSGIHSLTGTAKTINGTNAISIPNVTISGSYTNDNPISLTVGSALSGTGSLTQASNRTLNIGGTSTITTLTATSSGNTINFSGTAQSINAINYYHLTLSGSGVKTMPASTLSIAGDFATSGVANASAQGAIITSGNFTIGAGTKFDAASFSHTVGGNWVNNSTNFNSSSSSYTFNGSIAQNIGGTNPTAFNLITINNSSGITLGNAVNATGVTLSNGLVTTTSTNLLTVTGTSPTSITGSTSSYIYGPLAITLPANLVNGSYLFPIGKSAYNTFELINANTTSGGTVVIKAEVIDANCGGTAGVGMSQLNTDSYWSTSIPSGSGNFTNAQIRLTDTGMTSEYAIGQSATSSGSYDRISNDPPVGNTITSDPITTLSYFVIGKKPLVSIVATNNGTEGGSNGLFTLTTSRQFTVVRTINLVITGTATNGTDYTTINTTVNFPAFQNTVTVPVTITNDLLVEPTETVTITLATGTGYAVGTPDNATVNIFDNDVAGITVTPTSGLTTTEGGGLATFTVVLNSQPTANVTVGLSSNDLTEGTVLPSSLTFTSTNWNVPQTATVTGVDDLVQDGNVAYSIVTAPASSTDLNYKNLDPSDVSVVNNDNDVAGITVSPTSGLTTTELGGTATFTIVLNSQPTADVTIGLTSDDLTEGTVSPAYVIFTAANWNTPQIVTVTGLSDIIVDGNILYNIITAQATSSDGLYNGINPSNVSVTNIDNNVAGVTVSPSSGLVTTEAGGTANFTIVLTSQPSANVTISLASDDLSEGTVSPSSVTFTNSTWNTPQTIVVRGVDDAIADGNIVYHINTGASVSSDSNYSGKFPQVVTVTNNDNDVRGIPVSPTTLTTTEAAGTGNTKTFTVVLTTQPTASVTIGLSSGDTTEGTVSPSSLTFTTSNWNTAQTVTVTGVDDLVQDGNITYSVITAPATGGDYAGIDPSDVTVTNIDDDVAGITVSPTSGLTTTEALGTATFSIKLNSQPTADVSIGLSSNDLTEGTVSPASATFTSTNWNTTQTITVTGVNDFVADGNIVYSIVTAPATSTDLIYNGMNASDVSVTNLDNDVAGVTVTPTSGLVTTEAGGTATFTIKLNSQPTANVTINLSSSDPTEGTVSPSSVTFTSVTWNTAQTVTATGVDDFVVDGNQAYSILTVMATGADLIYNAINPSDVTATNNDNDVAGFTVSPTSGLTTTEASGIGHTTTFTVKLTSQPSANVTIGISSSNTAEGTISPASLTFTNATWNTVQTVTITGVDDLVMDGNKAYSVVTSVATSTDLNYSGFNPSDVSVTNIDNDVAGITVSPTSGRITTEAGGTDNFTIVLTSQPTANVTIGISSSNVTEGSVSTSSVIFTTANWNIAQTVTITGVADHVIDGNVLYTIITAPASSADANYNNMNPSDVSVTNNNIDVAGITVTPTSGLFTAENGSQATFTIVMNTIPSANVTISLISSDLTEGTVSPSSVTFTPATWNIPQTVTVTGVDDWIDDGDIGYSIVTSNATSTDSNYSGFVVSDIAVTNSDNDIAGISVNPTSGLITSEDLTSDAFTIVLNSQPLADVKINLSSDDTTEGTVSPLSVTFTASNWNVPQTVTVTGVDDYQVDGDIPYNIVTSLAISTDPKYNVINPDDVSVTNVDNDVAGITITPNSGLVTTEAGGTATFTVVLTSQPTDNVTIGLSSSNTAEGTVSTSLLTFTSSNWSTLQTVTVTGVNDALVDGDIAYSVLIDPAVSNDLDYDGFDPGDVSVTNLDRTPTINSFTPATVCYGSGTSVVISGTFFTGTTSVKFNGVSASFVVNSATQITATLPATATTGVISVVTPTGTAISGSSLTVNPLSVGGTISGSVSVCSGTNSTLLTLSGNIGAVTKWQSSSVSNFSSAVTDIANITTGLTVTNLTSTTYYRAVVTSGICSSANSSVATVTVNPLPTADAGAAMTAICQGATSAALGGSFGGGATSAIWSAPSGTFANNTGNTPGTATFTAAVNSTTPILLTLTTSGGSCGTTTATKNQVVNPNAVISLTSAVSTNAQTLCINNPITNITYSVSGGGTGAGVTGLPAGVSGLYSGSVFTISGTPSVSGTFNYAVTTTGTCSQTTATGSIVVTPINTITLTSGGGTDAQTKCISTVITNITYGTTGATGASFSGLPAGVTGAWASNVVTISGTPSASGTFSYTVTLTGGCGTVTKTGSIIVTPNNTISLSSTAGTDGQTVCISTPITPITYTTTGATGASFSNLPTGVTGAWASNVVTISGTPSVSGTFSYTIALTGGCGTVTKTGSITVTPNNTITLSSTAGTDAQTKCINTAITNITYTTTGATGASFSGLPAGVTGAWASNVVTISGTPSASGTFSYTITLTGGCGTVTKTGSITVTP
ncbi:MAG: Calx-beta domain-containing protein, partial [Mariniphaga sp.]